MLRSSSAAAFTGSPAGSRTVPNSSALVDCAWAAARAMRAPASLSGIVKITMPSYHDNSPNRLFFAERAQRIHRRGAARGTEARQQGNHREQCRDCEEHHRIERPDLED